MNRPVVALLFCAAALLKPLAAQAPAERPTMNPDAAAPADGEKKNPFGLTGLSGNRPKGAKTEITAKKQATFDNATSIAEFEGSVVVKDVQFTMFCDRLKVTLDKDRKGLELVEAYGNVIIVQESTDAKSSKTSKATGRSGKTVYDPATGKITLTLSPSVQHDINMQIGEAGTIMILHRDGKMETFGPSITRIIETGEAK